MEAMYPKTYYPTPGWRWFRLALASVAVGVWLCAMWLFAVIAVDTDWGILALMVGLLPGVAWSVCLAVEALRSKIVLYADRIEIHGLFGVRSLRREEIAGWRRSTQMLFLEGRDRPGYVMFWIYKEDATFQRWLEGIQ